MKTPVMRRLYQEQLIPVSRHALGVLPRPHPHAYHLRSDFAMSIGAHASAGPITQLFRTIHGTHHAGAVQDALTAHLTLKQGRF